MANLSGDEQWLLREAGDTGAAMIRVARERDHVAMSELANTLDLNEARAVAAGLAFAFALLEKQQSGE